MPAAFKDYYATLGVPKTATEAEIRKAFRKLARQHHPDVAQAKDKAAAEAKFKEINEAQEVLTDPEKRRKYDELGPDWERLQHAPPPPRRRSSGVGHGDEAQAREFHFEGTGFSDFFEQFFGGGASRTYGFPPGAGGSARGSGRQRGADIEGDILVTLEEAMHGTERPLRLQTIDPETGKEETHAFTVRIPAGASDGRRIRVPGQGAPGYGGGEAGDLFLRIRLAAHPDFRALGSDLYFDAELAPWEAVLGTELVVPGLSGALKVRIPPGTQNGQQLRLRGAGLPKGKSGERGDLYVVTGVAVPTVIDAEERVLWERLRDRSAFRPRA